MNDSVRRASCLLVVAVAVAILATSATVGATSASTQQMNGSGTAEDPYVVTDVTELQAISEDLDAHYVLGNDIDASETADWNGGAGFEPIGDDDQPFSGTLDGRNHTVSGLTISLPDRYDVGMFAVSTGTIRNLHVEGASITGFYGGVVVSNNHGTVHGVSATGEFDGTESGTGGLVGYGDGRISQSWAAVDVSSEDVYTGGLVGRNQGEVTDSYATGAVSGQGAGGIVGGNSESMQRVYATGAVRISNRDHEPRVGGIAADNANMVDAYYNTETSGRSSPVGEGTVQGTGLTTAEMTGTAAADSMEALVSDDAWITTDSYPRLQRNVEGLSAEFDGVLIAGNDAELSARLTLVGDRTESVVSVAEYESDDTTVATVDDGVLTGNEAGQATITVSHAGETATTDVVVIAAEGISPVDAELDATEVSTGEVVTVTGTFRNVDEDATHRNVSLRVDGEAVTTANVSVAGESEATQGFEWTPEETGSYDLAIEGVDAGTVTVTEAPSDGSGEDTDGSDGGTNGSSNSTDGGSEDSSGNGGGLPMGLFAVGAVAVLAVGVLAGRYL